MLELGYKICMFYLIICAWELVANDLLISQPGASSFLFLSLGMWRKSFMQRHAFWEAISLTLSWLFARCCARRSHCWGFCGRSWELLRWKKQYGLRKGCESAGAGAGGSALQHVVGAGILSAWFPTETPLLRALSLKVTIFRPRLLKSAS